LEVKQIEPVEYIALARAKAVVRQLRVNVYLPLRALIPALVA